MNAITLQLFQVTPSADFLARPARQAVESLVDSNLIDNPALLDRVLESSTVADLLNCFPLKNRGDNRILTIVLSHVLSSLEGNVRWSAQHRGIRVSDYEELAKGDQRSFVSARFASFGADRISGGQIFFNAMVRSRGLFSENIPVVEIIDDLLHVGGARNFYLRAFDTVHGHSCVITGVRSVPYFHNVPGTAVRWGDFFVKHKRMTPEQLAGRIRSYEAGDKDAANLHVAFCQHGRGGKSYGYPAEDLAIVASTSLQGFVDDRRNRGLPKVLEEAGGLCATGFKEIRACMSRKDALYDELKSVVSDLFETVPARQARCVEFAYEKSRKARRQSLFSLKSIADSKDELETLNCRNVVLYPSDRGSVETEETFLGFFTGATCQARRLGFQFKTMTFSETIAVQQPHTIVERVEAEIGPSANVVMAWRRYGDGRLTNNRLIEFELMRRGMAVQHVVDEGQRGNAHKVGHLLQGMAEKFALRPNRKCEIDIPFDLALGLDVSRFAGFAVPAFPVAVDREGNATLVMPKELDLDAKERRSNDEVIGILRAAAGGQRQKILFLRDGYAYEDFDAISAAIPEIELTVLSVRKNLLAAFSEDMPSGDFYAVYADHDSHRFVLGVNARQGENARVNSVHMVEIVRNPGDYSKDQLADVLIELSRQNRTSEFEIASLPFPIAYADRSAWVVRDMIQDRMLCKYVRDRYTSEVNAFGDEGAYIYSVIRNYVEHRVNGYAFAI